ncbi:MAG: hypothetical protein WCA78_16115 [Rhizomicrobium sp.]|jgi:hypothetical protein
MSQTIIVAVFSLLGVLLGGGLQYFFGRALETRRQLILQRSQSYVDFLKAVALVAQNGRSKENLSLAADAKTRICIYGATRVVQLLREFEAVGSNTGAQEGRAAIIALVKEMRADVGKRDRMIHEHELQEVLFPPISSDRKAKIESQ